MITVVAVGAGIVLAGWVIPAKVGLSMEFTVALMLILLGILNLTGMRNWAAPLRYRSGEFDATGHTDVERPVSSPGGHSHEHASLNRLDSAFWRIGLYQIMRPLLVGVVHGMAGSAAIALLVLATIRNPRWAVAYLLLFGVGTIAGMMLITSAIAAPFAYSAKLPSAVQPVLRAASGVLSVAFGLFLAYQRPGL